MRRGVARGLAAGLALAILAGGMEAQRVDGPAGHVGISFIAADPVGDLALFFDRGFGGQLEGAYAIDPEGRVRIRADLGLVIYGYEKQQYCYNVPIGCRIGLDLTTTNNIFFGGLGPELVLATGQWEPYVHASFGFSYFATTSSLGGDHGHDDFATTTNYSDAVFAWTVGGGVRVRLKGGHKPISLDIGVERHDNGIADFLTKGDIVDHDDGPITVFPNRSEANLMAFRVGISVGIPRRGSRH